MDRKKIDKNAPCKHMMQVVCVDSETSTKKQLCVKCSAVLYTWKIKGKNKND